MRGSRAQGSERRPVRRLLATVVTLMAAVTLTGCQSNPEPPPVEAAPSPSPSPSPTEPTTEPAPTMPAEAQGTSRAAAKAFVRHYVELMNHATATGDTGPLKSASDQGCASCNAVIERVEAVYSAGGSIASDGWEVRSVSFVPLQERDRPVVDLGIVMSPQVVIEERGAESKTFDGGRLPATFTLARSGEGWRVLSWERSA